MGETCRQRCRALLEVRTVHQPVGVLGARPCRRWRERRVPGRVASKVQPGDVDSPDGARENPTGIRRGFWSSAEASRVVDVVGTRELLDTEVAGLVSTVFFQPTTVATPWGANPLRKLFRRKCGEMSTVASGRKSAVFLWRSANHPAVSERLQVSANRFFVGGNTPQMRDLSGFAYTGLNGLVVWKNGGQPVHRPVFAGVPR